MTRSLGILLAGFVFVVWAYWPGIDAPLFPVDDDMLTKIPQLQATPSPASLKTLLTPGTHVDFYPVRDLTYLVDIHVLGGEPAAFRAQNFFWFFVLAAGLLVLLVICGVKWHVARFVTLLWMIHPYHSEMLMTAAARKDVLALAFGVWAVNFFLMRKYRAVSIPLFAASLLSKASLTGLPFAALALLPMTERVPRDRLALASLAACSALSLGSMIFQGWFYTSVNDIRSFIATGDRVLTSAAALGRMLAGVFNPTANIVDIDNQGQWLARNKAYVVLGLFGWLAFLTALVIGIARRHLPLLYFALLMLLLYLPISGLLIPHRGFYSARYFEPMLLVLFVVVALYSPRFPINKFKSIIATSCIAGAAVMTTFEGLAWSSVERVFDKALRDSSDSISLKAQALNWLTVLHSQKGLSAEEFAKIRQLQTELVEACTSDRIEKNELLSCALFYEYVWTYKVVKVPGLNPNRAYSLLISSLEERRPIPKKLWRAKLDRMLENGERDQALLARWKAENQWKILEAYRVQDVVVRCLLEGPENAWGLAREYLSRRLLSPETSKYAPAGLEGCFSKK